MMDLKEIIRWLFPCLHGSVKNAGVLFTVLFLFLLLCPSLEAKSFSVSERSDQSFKLNNDTKNIFNLTNKKLNQSENVYGERSLDVGTGRTFGLRLRKMAQALIPLVFQLGMAATWAVVAALVGMKTLLVTLVILKLLLVAGAAKVLYVLIGSLFGGKVHHQPQPWQPHQKEIHLHIHNGGHGHPEEHEVYPAPWNREGTPGVQVPAPLPIAAETRPYNVVYDPYSAGPQTISTPFGHYVKIEPVRNFVNAQGNT